MKQSKVVQAYKVLLKLGAVEMPIKTAYSLYKLRKALEPQWEFQREREMAIVDALGATVGVDGVVMFKKTEDRLEFAERMLELAETDVDIAFDRVKLDLKNVNADLSMDELSALEEFVEVE